MKIHLGRYNKETFIDIVDDYYCPISPWVSVYSTNILSGYSVDTRLQYVKQLKSVIAYFSDKGIDIVERVATGEFFLRTELDAFFNHCQINEVGDKSNIFNISTSSDKAIDTAIHSSHVAGSKVNASTARGKITRFQAFVSFLYDSLHYDNREPNDLRLRHEQLHAYLRDKSKILKDFNTECKGLGESVIPTNVFLKLVDVIKPDSPQNPFTIARMRNYLIVALMIETGIRRGAVAKLKISDCKFWGSYDEITITRTPDDETDPRKYRPSQKTKPHKSFVSPELMHKLKWYIDNVRSRFPASSTHEMVFVTEKNNQGTAGLPIALSSIDKLFLKLSSAINYHIHPHLLRHKFNEIFSDYAREKGICAEEEEKLRKYMMGWSRDSDSQMAEIYNAFKIYEQVKEYQLMRQNEMI